MSVQDVLCTGVSSLDTVLGGGIPSNSLMVLAGEPGTGKTVLAQQILFNLMAEDPDVKALYISTLSEPALNMARYMQRFSFFDPELFGERIVYQDIGGVLRKSSLDTVLDEIIDLVRKHDASFLVIDSYKAILEMAPSQAAFRRFCFDVSLRLSTIRCTTFLVGEYAREAVSQATEFAVADGIVFLSLTTLNGERTRQMQVLKMRGQNPITSSIPFSISGQGIHVLYGLGGLEDTCEMPLTEESVPTGIFGLDSLLRGGIPKGKCMLVAGSSGSGKTTLCLQTVAGFAKAGHRCVYFSFEEPVENLLQLGERFGFDLRALVERDLVRIICTPLTDIRMEEELASMAETIKEFTPECVVIDSTSVLMHRLESQSEQRHKFWQICQLSHYNGAIGLLVSDIANGESGRLSRFGVEETLTDCVMVLGSSMQEGRRSRHVEINKLRNQPVIEGKHYMEIGPAGIEVFYIEPRDSSAPKNQLELSFVPVQELIEDSIDYSSSWLCRGQPGVGKSSVGGQFALEGLMDEESAIIVTLDGPTSQTIEALAAMNPKVPEWLQAGRLAIIDAFTPGGPDFRMWDSFMFAVYRKLITMQRPLRLVMDSLSPILAVYGTEGLELLYQKNRMLRLPQVALFDTAPLSAGKAPGASALVDFYDVVLDLFTPDWGDMKSAGDIGMHAMQITKARGVKADLQPYPYTLSHKEGISIQTRFYQREKTRF